MRSRPDGGYLSGPKPETGTPPKPRLFTAPIMSEKPLYGVIEDAMWQALDSEHAMPHSRVDPAYVVPEFLRLLDAAGYTITPVVTDGRMR